MATIFIYFFKLNLFLTVVSCHCRVRLLFSMNFNEYTN